MRARNGAGATLDPNSVHYIGIISYDVDGHVIRPQNFMKNDEAVDTTLALDLEPGDMTITLSDATGWYDGSNQLLRSIVWYGYENSLGFTYPDYTYTRNVANWGENGIDGNVITLEKGWEGPTLRAGEPVRNAGSGYMHNFRFLAPGHVSEERQQLHRTIGGINLRARINGARFRPGTHSISALVLADFTDTGTQLTLSDFTVSCRQRPIKQLVDR